MWVVPHPPTMQIACGAPGQSFSFFFFLLGEVCVFLGVGTWTCMKLYFLTSYKSMQNKGEYLKN